MADAFSSSSHFGEGRNPACHIIPHGGQGPIWCVSPLCEVLSIVWVPAVAEMKVRQVSSELSMKDAAQLCDSVQYGQADRAFAFLKTRALH